MEHSVHNVFRGGFDYYQSRDVTPINDDQPTPQFDRSIRTDFGIPASLAGRPLPADAKKTGHGLTARGAVSSGKVGVWAGTEKKSGMPSGIGEALGLGEFDNKNIQAVIGIVLLIGLGYIVVRAGKEARRVR